MDRLPRLTLAFAWIAALCAPPAALAQPYPSKPIRVIHTFVASSIADGALRLVSQKMSESMGQPVIVESQSGAAGIIGAQMVMRSAPDGYTLLLTNPTAVVSAPFLLKNRPFDPIKDFTPITDAIGAVLCLVVSDSFPPNSVRELIAHIKANPGKFAYGTTGIGSQYHLEMEVIKLHYGLEITHVPYRSGGEQLNAVAAGFIPVAFAPLGGQTMGLAKSGKIKVLAIMEAKRYPGAPDIPAIAEQLPEYEKVPNGMFYYGPAGMPASIVKRLYEEIVKALNTQEVLDRLRQLALFPIASTPEAFAARTRKDIEISARAIKAAGLKPE